MQRDDLVERQVEIGGHPDRLRREPLESALHLEDCELEGRQRLLVGVLREMPAPSRRERLGLSGRRGLAAAHLLFRCSLGTGGAAPEIDTRCGATVSGRMKANIELIRRSFIKFLLTLHGQLIL
ncbi:hypothetical protein P9209_03145 [Prescottella defluvii]|nr:hypothetical protein P9209_03145 [Prescottella defluvii]